ncbi:hypothetical protein VTK56DRAFT_7465 [Thermocarpiscus australiensis]
MDSRGSASPDQSSPPRLLAEARVLPDLPDEFRRTLNARSNMSNGLPGTANPNHVPYCDWYPDVASKDALSTLKTPRILELRNHTLVWCILHTH